MSNHLTMDSGKLETIDENKPLVIGLEQFQIEDISSKLPRDWSAKVFLEGKELRFSL